MFMCGYVYPCGDLAPGAKQAIIKMCECEYVSICTLMKPSTPDTHYPTHALHARGSRPFLEMFRMKGSDQDEGVESVQDEGVQT